MAAKLRALEGIDSAGLTHPDLMQRFLQFQKDDRPWQVPTGVTVADDHVEGKENRIPIRVYRPKVEPRAALLWLHGGGFRIGDLDMPEAHVVAAELADRAAALVVSVDYRLAVGGVRFPAPVDDAITAWRALADLVGADIPIAIGGASAGAAIAMSAALRAQSETGQAADALLLCYPFVHFPVPAIDRALADEMRALPPLVRYTAESIAQMVAAYVGRISSLPAEAMPGAAQLDCLPPTTIVLSEYDDLRPSGELLARQLDESGVPARTYLAQGMLHGHLNRLPGLLEVDRSLDVLADGLTMGNPGTR
jgi:acetyl esterase/lipase